MSYALLVLAAGKGKRMNSDVKKQYMKLAGKPLIYRTLKNISDCIDLFNRVVLLVPAGDEEFVRGEILTQLSQKVTRQLELAAGGHSRRNTVKRGLDYLEGETDYVIVHDGARPFVGSTLMNRVVQEVEEKKAVVVGTPVTDTIKRIDDEGLVEETVDRDEIVSVQTPQAFSSDLLERAHREVSQEADISDDAMLVEGIGEEVFVVEGSFSNIKITNPRDLILAEALIERGGEMGEG